MIVLKNVFRFVLLYVKICVRFSLEPIWTNLQIANLLVYMFSLVPTRILNSARDEIVTSVLRYIYKKQK